MVREPARRRRMLWLVIGALAAWGLLIGVGSYLGIDSGTPDRDLRRLAIVGGSVALFLAVWLTALWLRSRRMRKRPTGKDAAETSNSTGGK